MRGLLAAAALLGVATRAEAATVPVSNVTELRAAVAAAKAGDEIVLAPGTYVVSGANVSCSANGTAAAPIVVRSATPLAAKLELSTVEGFVVTGSDWHFEGLDVKGTCANDTDCEHAFHVTGGASRFVLRASRVADFNAQLKVNASAGGAQIPDHGLVEGCELFDTHARATDNPVTKVNIDTGDGWVVRANYIHDFHRTSASATYGAFMKSGGKNGLFERNLVVCTKDEKTAGTYIGLSFGGGGTGAQFCAPAFDAGTPCSIEHTDGTMRNNVIASCSDVGIYVNRGENTKLLYNTLIATSGIDFRFDTTSGVARGNVLAGSIRDRDGATHTAFDDLTGVSQATFDAMYQAPLVGDLRKKGDLSSLIGKAAPDPDVPDDYCARARAGSWDLGALQHSLGDCATVLPPLGGAGSGADGGAGAGDGGAGNGGGAGGDPAGGGSSGGAAGPDGAAPGAGEGGSPDDGGCGCRAAGHGDARGVWIAVALIALGAGAGAARSRGRARRRTRRR
jgi:hypothetical protein